ncbi:hypothetical protein [Tahibacter sp.]|uniref:hypothetical protein n=1 Tax=Tahibacter sp. TaxID=2056211 RepID=UPI0028C4B832|nr:hypothetical protein [Tahibacter sp.]
MRITLKIHCEKLSQALPATVFLETQTAIEFHNAERGLRHPTSLYAHSLRTVVEAFNRVLDELDALSQVDARKRLGSIPATALARDTESLIHAVFEHVEHCKSVVLVFAHDLSSKEQGKRIRGFSATAQDARAFAGSQANTIKHSQGSVRLMQMVGDRVVVPGYYIEGVDAEGMISPHPEVHPGGRTAFSFGRALRYLACSVRFVSGALVSSLDAAHRLDDSRIGLGPLAAIFGRLAGFDRYVFPGEGGEVVPSIAVRGSALVIDFPSRDR